MGECETLPRGYEVTEALRDGVPCLKAEYVPATVRQARAAEKEERREARQREALRGMPGYVKRGMSAPPGDRVLEPGEIDQPEAYVYRSRRRDLYFLFGEPTVASTAKGNETLRYYQWKRDYWREAPPKGSRPVVSLPDGYELVDDSEWGTPRLKKRKRYLALPDGSPVPERPPAMEMDTREHPEIRAAADSAGAGGCFLAAIPGDARGRRVLGFNTGRWPLWYLHRFSVPHPQSQGKTRTYYRFLSGKVRADESIDAVPDGYWIHVKQAQYSSTSYLTKRGGPADSSS